MKEDSFWRRYLCAVKDVVKKEFFVEIEDKPEGKAEGGMPASDNGAAMPPDYIAERAQTVER